MPRLPPLVCPPRRPAIEVDLDTSWAIHGANWDANVGDRKIQLVPSGVLFTSPSPFPASLGIPRSSSQCMSAAGPFERTHRR